ncbi:acetyl-CoA decarbonylase/synthase complex subunit alpha [Candidatus Methanophagaceae archaeon]|nr:acetyl-CoA decarbonylase/synthase complex subunit alpha [Methanophagales archaeon]
MECILCAIIDRLSRILCFKEELESKCKKELGAKMQNRDNRRFVKVGEVEVLLEDAVRDLRGKEIEDIAEDILREMGERRLKLWQPKLNIYAHAADIAEWDNVLLNRYYPRYTNIKAVCDNCTQGPCAIDPPGSKIGLCGLDLGEAYQAKLSLQEACKGLSQQLTVARALFNFSLPTFGVTKAIDIGRSITYPTMNTSMLTGFYTKNLGDIGRALSYAESQLSELLLAAYSGNESVLEFEEKALHAGSLTFLAMELSESIKMCCFEFLNAGKHPGTEYPKFPAVETRVGMGTVDTNKPVVVFMGNIFLPAWFAVEHVKRETLEDAIEICGVGAVGHDIPRFYKRGKVITSGVKARKVIRAGIPDVVVVNELCTGFDVLAEAKRVDTKVIASGYTTMESLEDRSDDSVEDVLAAIIDSDLPGVRISSPEKAGELAVKLATVLKERGKRQDSYLLPEEALKRNASQCNSCDSCVGACPGGLELSNAMAAAKTNLEPLADIYEECMFCGKCERACPEGIHILDLAISAASVLGRLKDDNYLMRAGRGPMSELEWRDLTFGVILGGNGPGMVNIIGCGNYPGSEREVAAMTRYFLDRNYLVCVSGCVAADVAKYFDEEEQKFLFEQYIAAGVLKGLVNFGGCTAMSHVPSAIYRGALVGSAYTPKANWTQIADYLYARLPVVVIIWGAATETLYSVASGLVRSGIPVVVGPSGFEFKRFFLGDKDDRSKWWMYDGVTGERKEVEPCPVHMLVPVETKEEAIAMCAKLLHRPLALRDPRLASLEAENEAHKEFFGEYSDDWHLYVRSEQELHVMRRMELLKKLEVEHGWEIEGTRIKRARHRSGELMDMSEYNEKYGIQLGRYSTLVPRLITRSDEDYKSI